MAVKIRLEGVTKIYGGANTQRALKLLKSGASKDEIFSKTNCVVGLSDVNFEVEEGEIFVVMGLSGSGKSTLIRCVNRLLEPTSGKIIVNDQDVMKMNKKELRQIRRKSMAMVFQHFALFPHKTVIYNASYGLTIRGEKEEDARERALEALAMVGLRDWADHYPENLSGGMQQRVGLARGLATDADILLMDEAFSALDPLIRREMQDELVDLQERLQKTILFITHDLGEALRVGDRIAIMRDGYVVQIGTPEEIVTKPSNEYVADFIADVDSGRVLTAEFIMSPAEPVSAKKHLVNEALKRMDRLDSDHLYVTNKDKGVDGLLHREDLMALYAQGEDKFDSVIKGDYPRASLNSRLNELYPLSTNGVPIAIIDENGRLDGVVYPLHIFEALTKNDPVLDTNTSGSNGVHSSNGHHVEEIERKVQPNTESGD